MKIIKLSGSPSISSKIKQSKSNQFDSRNRSSKTKNIALNLLVIFSLLLMPLAYILVFNTQQVNASEVVYEWAKGIGGTGLDTGYSVTTDSSGNLYTTGIFSDTVDFDPSDSVYNMTSAGATDVFISKLDSNGDFIWARSIGGQYGDTPRSIIVDSFGSLYIAGSFQMSIDVDPGFGVHNLTSGSFGTFILKLDSNGDFVWAKGITSAGYGSCNAYSVALDENGNLYTVGYFSETFDFDPGAGVYNMTSAGGGDDIFISKLDSNGDFVWAKRMGGSSTDRANSVAVDIAGNVYVSGWFAATADFDPGVGVYNLTSAGASDIFISKLDSNGDFVWAKRMGNTGSDSSASSAIDSVGNVYSAGNFNGTVDFDPGDGVHNLVSAGSDDVFISKLDSNGDFVWAKRFGNGNPELLGAMTLDADDNVYTTGYVSGVVDFDPGDGVYSSSGFYRDLFISKLDLNGDFVWAKRMGNTNEERPYSVTVDSVGNVYTTGAFEGTVDFDPGDGVSNISVAGYIDAFIIKLSPPGPPQLDLLPATDVQYSSMSLNAEILQTGDLDVTERGFEYGLDNSYGSSVSESSGPYTIGLFSASLAGLECETEYYYRGYAITSAGTGYTAEGTLTTDTCPVYEVVMSASTADSITQTSATLHSEISSTGGNSPTERGFEYGLDNSYGSTIASISVDGYGVGVYSRMVDNLVCGTTYFYRSYATNVSGTGYGTGNTFQTLACPSPGGSSSGSIIRKPDQSTSPGVDTPVLSTGLIPVYRQYNNGLKDHFYTTNLSEKAHAKNSLGYFDEGVLGYISPVEQENQVPVYRLYNPQSKNHFYTLSLEEKSKAQSSGFIEEHILGYSDPKTFTLPVYRLYNSQDKDHFYTTSKQEADVAVSKLRYVLESVLSWVR